MAFITQCYLGRRKKIKLLVLPFLYMTCLQYTDQISSNYFKMNMSYGAHQDYIDQS